MYGKTRWMATGLFVCLLLSALLFAATVLGAETQDVSSAPDHIVLTWTEDARTTQTISWRTSEMALPGKVRFVEALAGAGTETWEKSRLVDALQTHFSTNRGDVTLHSVTLTGLKPGTRYAYQVRNGDESSPTHYFSTVPAQAASYKFMVFGDSQSINHGTWANTLHSARKSNPDALFFINTGDLVDVGQDYAQWTAWFEAAAGVMESIPIMPLPGNHESYSPYRTFSRPSYFTSLFRLPMNGPEGLQGQVYSFDVGDVHFVMLDTQEGEQARFVPDLLEKQQAWLDEDLRLHRKKWNLVFLHRPPYNNKPDDGNRNIRSAFVPIFDKYHVDVVFSAHDHVVARTFPMKEGMVVENPTQGTIYAATGRSGSKTYRDVSAKEWNSFFMNPVEETNFLTVQVTATKLTVQVFGQSGALVDSWEIDKRITDSVTKGVLP